MSAVNPQSLPDLRRVSILVSGPDPGMDGSAASGWQEMPTVNMQHVNCDVLDVSDKLIVEHPLFYKSRLRHLTYEPEPQIRQLVNYLTLFKAWLWHGSHWDIHDPHVITEVPLWDFFGYLFMENTDACPLGHLPGWCPGHHTKDEMLNLSSLFTVDFKFLVEKRCRAELNSSSALELDPAGNYERFIQFMEKRIADFETRKMLEHVTP
jgi:hypothetical protein